MLDVGGQWVNAKKLKCARNDCPEIQCPYSMIQPQINVSCSIKHELLFISGTIVHCSSYWTFAHLALVSAWHRVFSNGLVLLLSLSLHGYVSLVNLDWGCLLADEIILWRLVIVAETELGDERFWVTSEEAVVAED